jgi:hypothetical protein
LRGETDVTASLRTGFSSAPRAATFLIYGGAAGAMPIDVDVSVRARRHAGARSGDRFAPKPSAF